MWFQRKPELFVDRSKGWEGISLPFTAELVTTNQKGEITHFFNGSLTSKNDTGTKIGHEYWLRDYKGGLEYVTADHVVKANLSYPSSAESDYEAPVGGTKDDIMSVVWNKTGQDAVTNTFLWDYYYKENNRNRKDANNDEYQTYYNSTREFSDYPLLTQGLPYIIGFPGVTYYEFDLSGSFTASNTATPITKLDPQVITFASATGTSINVSDAEKKGVTYKETNTQYTFRPSYLNETLTCGDVVENGITSAYFNMNSDGNAFYKLSNVEASYTFDNGQTYADADDFAAALAAAGTLYTAKDINAIATSWADASTTYYKLTSVTPSENDQHGVTPSVLAFRPYFISTLGGSNVKRETRAIVFSDDDSDLGKDEEEVLDKPGELIIRTRERKIYVTSTLSKEANVTIVNAAGALINTYKIQPGETIVTEIHNPGIYLVNKTKLSIK